MKVIKITKKQLRISMIFIFTILIFAFCYTSSIGMQHYYKLDFVTGIVTASTLNVRSGPSTKCPVITSVKKNEYVRVFAGIGDWYVIQTDSDHIGAVSKQYIKAIYPSSNNTGGGTNTGNNTGSNQVGFTADEQEVFNLINAQRTKQGLVALKIDNEVQKVARIKAQDMVDNNYFSHTSPTYGSPFDMLKSFKVSYKTAGENIAGNSSNSAAVTAWMNSEGHKANILNGKFTYTGIGVVKSNKYGKMYVQMFIGK